MNNEQKLWTIFGGIVLAGVLLVSLGYFVAMVWTLRSHYQNDAQKTSSPPKEIVLDCVFDSASKSKADVRMKCKEIK